MTRDICIDASVIVKWFVPEDHEEQAVSLAEEVSSRGLIQIAPEFVFAEASNGVLKHVRRGTTETMQGLRIIATLLRLRIEKYDCHDLYLDAWRIALLYDRPAIYDCYYLALAEQQGCDLWTADTRFFNAVGNHPQVHHIKDFVPGMLGSQ